GPGAGAGHEEAGSSALHDVTDTMRITPVRVLTKQRNPCRTAGFGCVPPVGGVPEEPPASHAAKKKGTTLRSSRASPTTQAVGSLPRPKRRARLVVELRRFEPLTPSMRTSMRTS